MIGPFRYGYHMVTSGTSLHDECLLALKLVQRFSDQDHLSLEVLHVRTARGLVRASVQPPVDIATAVDAWPASARAIDPVPEPDAVGDGGTHSQ